MMNVIRIDPPTKYQCQIGMCYILYNLEINIKWRFYLNPRNSNKIHQIYVNLLHVNKLSKVKHGRKCLIAIHYRISLTNVGQPIDNYNGYQGTY